MNRLMKKKENQNHRIIETKNYENRLTSYSGNCLQSVFISSIYLEQIMKISPIVLKLCVCLFQ